MKSKPYKKTPLPSQSGFTVIELAIVLIIFGMFTSTLALAYTLYIGSQAKDNTIEAISETELAILEFQLDMRRYPCPANINLGPNDPNFGLEDCALAAPPPVGGRDVDEDGNPELVMIGGIPFRTLVQTVGADQGGSYVEKYGFDGWNRKITYAVTQNLTNTETYDVSNGAIEIMDEMRISMLDEPGTAHFVLISHGRNGKGGYSRNGNRVDNCAVGLQRQQDIDAGIFVPPDETTNCQFTDATFLDGLRNDTDRDYNDDIVKGSISLAPDIWVFGEDGVIDEAGNLQRQIFNTNDGNVGIGIDTPQQSVHVSGDIQAFEVHAQSLCDAFGTDCMNPEALGGELEDMQCPPGHVIQSIEQNRVNCVNPFAANIGGNCSDMGPDFYLVGYSSTNGIICERF